MIQYVLDTNAVIDLLKEKKSTIGRRVRACHPMEIGISSIVVHELFYGAYKSQRSQQNVLLVDNLQFEILEFDKEDARQAGEIRAMLAVKGKPIGPYDVLIAGQAKARDLVLITDNTQEFHRVHGLKIENWKNPNL
jgi:tRNA(fMet)-specific endonuclease VapC